MKKNIFYVVMMAIVVLMTACTNDERPGSMGDVDGRGTSRTTGESKTVLVYMAGRNNLYDALEDDLREIKEGSKLLRDNENMLVFVRRYSNEAKPWLARIKNGEVIDSVSVSDMGIVSNDDLNRASDPDVMEGVLRYAFKHYPAANNNYGLVLWGHGSGWNVNKEVKVKKSLSNQRAFGIDLGNSRNWNDGCWINFTTMKEILMRLPHLKFIMGDCCNLMCLENLYELRNVCDYMIGSPAEIPGQGAPYDKIVPDFFADGKFYSNIIKKYYTSVEVPLTAVQTCEMEHVAEATRQALQSVKAHLGDSYADMTGMIHYYHTDSSNEFRPEYNIFYDAGDFLRTYASSDAYQMWKQALDKAIVELHTATCWNVDKTWVKYSDFTVTDEKMHGVSMFVPQNPAKGDYAQYNKDIRQFEWYQAAGLSEIGW